MGPGRVELSFLPKLLRRRLAAGEPLDGAWQVLGPSAVLLVDVRGLSALAEPLSAGRSGVPEPAGRPLERWAGELVARVDAAGGEVLSFAGETLVCAWSPSDGQDDTASLRRAAACALAIRRHVHGVDVGDGLGLSVQMGLVSCTLAIGLVGGHRGRFLVYAAGPALSRLNALGPSLVAGQLTVDADTWDALRSGARGERSHDGSFVVHDFFDEGVEGNASADVVPDVALAQLAAVLPDAALRGADRGGEVRRVSSVFVDLSEFGRSTSVERLQAAVFTLQEIVARFDGVVDKLAIDVGGLTLVAVFGEGPRAGEDDAVRAVMAAIAIARRLGPLSVRPAVGVASGRAWCGTVVGGARRESTMIGEVPSLAARLLQFARMRSDDDAAALAAVACDETTARAAAHQVAFVRKSTVILRGRALPAGVYQPLGDGRNGEPAAVVPPMIGRARERAMLSGRLDELGRRRGGLVMVSAAPGLGKTRLVIDVLDDAVRRGFPAFVGVADPVERSTPYYAWRAVFARMLGTEGRRDLAALRAEISGRMEGDPDRVKLLPLLDAVVRLDFDENTLTRQMSPIVRADNTHLLLAWLAGRVAAQRPFLVVIDDAQWLDSASWEVVRVLVRDVPGVLVVLAHRPFDAVALADGATPPAWLLGASTATATGDAAFRPDVAQVKLEGLGVDEVRAFLAQVLGCEHVQEELTAQVFAVAKGHPLFTAELAIGLREAGRIVVVDGRCAVRAEGPLVDVGAGTTVEKVLAERILRLGQREQRTLLVASVLGRTFTLPTLRAVHPSGLTDGELADVLERLVAADLIGVESPGAAGGYAFRHGLTQQVANQLLAEPQRVSLHRAVAEHLERDEAKDVAQRHGLLAWHWRRAGEWGRAIHHLERAGLDALRRSANTDAVRFLQEALVLSADLGAAQVDRQARWHRQIGEARFALGDLDGCRVAMLAAIGRLGRPMPASSAAVVVSILWLVAIQAVQRWSPVARRFAEGEERGLLLETARAAERGTEVFYLNNQELHAFWCAMVALDAADRAGPSAELVRAYASMALAAGVLGQHGLAMAYRQLAIRADTAVGELASHTWMQGLLGTYAMGIGNWPDARARFSEAIGLHRRLGDWARWANCVLPRAWVALWEGDTGVASAEFAMVSAERRQSSVVYEAIALAGMAASALRAGAPDAAPRARVYVADGIAALGIVKDRAAEILLYGLDAAACARSGDELAARRAIDAAMPLIEGGSPLGSYLMEGYAGAAEAAVWLARRDPAGAETAKRALKALRKFSGPFPIARARTGWLEVELAPAGRQTRRALERVLLDAERYGQPWEVGLAHAGLARIEGADRATHLEAAARAFARVGANDRLEGVRLMQAAP